MSGHILFINTVDINSSLVAVISDKKVFQLTRASQNRVSESLLPMIIQLLKKRKLRFSEITGIVVLRGPGSFTGVRVGVAVANALSYALNIPVTGLKATEIPSDFRQIQSRRKHRGLVAPFYDQPPHITKPKSP